MEDVDKYASTSHHRERNVDKFELWSLLWLQGLYIVEMLLQDK